MRMKVLEIGTNGITSAARSFKVLTRKCEKREQCLVLDTYNEFLNLIPINYCTILSNPSPLSSTKDANIHDKRKITPLRARRVHR